MKTKIVFGSMIILSSLFLINTVSAQVSEYTQITEQTCNACTVCPEGLECINFPGVGSRCAEPDPCSYYQCPPNTECNVLRTAMAQVCPDGRNVGVTPKVNCQGVGSDYPDMGGKTGVSYDTRTDEVIIGGQFQGVSIKSDKPITSEGYDGYASGDTITIGATPIKLGSELRVEESKLFMETSAGEKAINILPEDAVAAVATPKMESVEVVELREESQQPIYSVKGVIQTKLFLMIPVSMVIETSVSAETGEIISVHKPWWSFLVW